MPPWLILIADDSAIDRETYIRYLTRDLPGVYRVVEAATGEEALKLATVERPDCILLDYFLPDCEGIELLDELQVVGSGRASPVVIVTGGGSEATAVQAMKRGARDYLIKSEIGPERLRRTIETVILHDRLERELEQSRRLLARIADALPDVLYLHDLREARTVFINRSPAVLLGYEPGEIARWGELHFEQLMHPDDRVGFVEHWVRLAGLPPGQVLECTYRLRHADGNWHWFASRDTRLGRDPEGAERVVGTTRDISDQVRSALALRRYRDIFVNTAQPIAVTCGDDPVFELVNPAFARLHGWESPEDMVGRRVIDIYAPEHHPQVRAAFEVLLERGHYVFEADHLRRDGSRFPAQMDATAVFDEGGRLLYRIIYVSDIAGHRRAEAERHELLDRTEAARAQAERANRSKDEFLAILSHELRTPLNPIIGWTQLIQRGRLSADEQRRALETIERNARLQKQLIEDLLDASRVAEGRFTFHMQRVRPTPLVHAAVESARPLAEGADIALSAELADLPEIDADPTRLAQVVWNLLTNAVKFTPAGGRITVTLDGRGPWIRLRVIDTGIGIASEFLPRLFERFGQADSSPTRRQGGLGLGLFIVRHIVEAHSGLVWAESNGPNQGSTFTVELPAL
jgi:PAS domain S-box-containing protein